MDQEHK